MTAIILSILLPILFIIAVVIITTKRSGGRGRSKAEKGDHRTRQEHAVWAWATVISSQGAPVDASGKVRVELSLQVHLPGSEPYTARTTWLVEMGSLGYIENGKEVSVKVDPQAPSYVYPNGPWAMFVE